MQSNSFNDINPADLPSPPQATLNIVHACSDESVSNTQLSDLVSSDLTLTAEILRLVNSSFFSLGTEVASINKAISIIGHRTLRNLALCIAVRDAINSDTFANFDTDSYWRDSLLRAVSARHIGLKLKFDHDDCFTAGLLQDFGIMVLFHLNTDQMKQWDSLRLKTPHERYHIEQEMFGYTHDQVMEVLGKLWSLPEDLTNAISHHHTCALDETNKPQLCNVLHCSDWLASLFSAENKSIVLKESMEILESLLHMPTEDIDILLKDIPDQVAQASNALGLHIKSDLDFEHVMREANEKLASDNLSYQELTWKLENTLKERDRLSKELDRELFLAREIQTSLQPKEREKSFPVVGINISAKELSGDFYDYIELKNGDIYFTLADVSGKGTHAAMLMAKASGLFRCLAKKVSKPDQLLSIINSELCETNIRGMFITMIAGIYHPKDKSVEIINAGNPPGLLFDKTGNVKQIDALTIPLGIIPGCDFPVQTFSLKDSTLYLYTDGVSEGKLSNNQEIGINGLQKLISKVVTLEKSERLKKIVSVFENKSALHDDITLLIIEGR
ncbi:MAG: HDOD domain-containing protein [Thiohalomonadales bacterium]